jgi:hypothetical protein
VAVLAHLALLALLAHLAVAAHLAQPLVRAHLVRRAWPQVVAVPVVRARLVPLVWLQVLVLPVVRAHLLVPAHLVRVVVVLAELAVEAAPQLTRSFSAAMAGTLPPPVPPMYAPAPRSRRKPTRRR